MQDTVVKTIPVIWANQTMTAICYDPANNMVYVADSDDYPGQVTVIDCARDSAITSFAAGHSPGVLTCNPRDNKVYCANAGGSNVAIIWADSNKIYAYDTVGSTPLAECYDPIVDKVFVASYRGDKITEIDGRTDNVVTALGVNGHPVAMALDPAQNRLYVANPSAFSVAVLGVEEGIQERDQLAGNMSPLEVWPNPCRGVLHVRAAATSTSLKPDLLEIYDAAGRRDMGFMVKPGVVADLDLRRFAPGVYFVREGPLAVSRQPSAIRKVILTR
jgi:hypothetical protein